MSRLLFLPEFLLIGGRLASEGRPAASSDSAAAAAAMARPSAASRAETVAAAHARNPSARAAGASDARAAGAADAPAAGASDARAAGASEGRAAGAADAAAAGASDARAAGAADAAAAGAFEGRAAGASEGRAAGASEGRAAGAADAAAAGAFEGRAAGASDARAAGAADACPFSACAVCSAGQPAMVLRLRRLRFGAEGIPSSSLLLRVQSPAPGSPEVMPPRSLPLELEPELEEAEVARSHRAADLRFARRAAAAPGALTPLRAEALTIARERAGSTRPSERCLRLAKYGRPVSATEGGGSPAAGSSTDDGDPEDEE